MDRSICEYFYDAGGATGHKCGYCGSEEGSVSNGMWAHLLTCEDYQDLIDRGWRRSGKYCYKPVMDVTCSPQYAIRCEVTEFRLSKSQKKVLKTMSDYLVKGRSREASKGEGSSVDADTTSRPKGEEKASNKVKSVRPGDGADPSKPRCRKAKEIRKEKKLKKQADQSDSTGETSMAPKPVRTSDSAGGTSTAPKPIGTSDSAGGTSPAPKPVDTYGSASKATGPVTNVHASSSKPQTQGQDIPDFLKVGRDGKKPLESFLNIPTDHPVAHKLEIHLVRSHPPSPEFKSTFRESYQLYKKYQMAIHDDEEDKCTEKQFTRFLCDSPLIPKKGASHNWPCDYGSYHQHYRLDGKLVAVGVVDFLPKCLSSVYTYYDPDYNFLSLGVYTALRELELTRKMYLGDPEHFLYYCMGYYVHECPKMRYKGQYSPSFLLCPESYQYIQIETCRLKLDISRYARLNDEATPPEDVATWLDKCLILSQQTIMPYAIYKALAGTREEEKVTEYARFVGPAVASRMVLVL